MDLLHSMKPRHCMKHWIYQKHQESKYMSVLFKTVQKLTSFQSSCLDFPACPDLVSQQPWSNLQVLLVAKHPGVPALCKLVCQQKKWSALHFNEKAYAFVCCAGVETENLDLFAKSRVSNMWQDERKGFKAWFKAKLTWEGFNCFSLCDLFLLGLGFVGFFVCLGLF